MSQIKLLASILFTLMLVACGQGTEQLDPNDPSGQVQVGQSVTRVEEDNLRTTEVKVLNDICEALDQHQQFAQSNLIDKNVVLNFRVEKKECTEAGSYSLDVGVKLVSGGSSVRFERVRGGNQFFSEFETTSSPNFSRLCDGVTLSSDQIRRYRSSGDETTWVRLYESNSHYCPRTKDTRCAVFIKGQKQLDGRYLVRQVEALTISTAKGDEKGMVVIRGRESKILCQQNRILMNSVFTGF